MEAGNYSIEALPDLYPVGDLPSRYELGRTALYTRLKALQIEPLKQGARSFVTTEQLQLLDDLHQHLSNGGLIGDFPRVREVSQQEYEVREGDIVRAADENTERSDFFRQRNQVQAPPEQLAPVAIATGEARFLGVVVSAIEAVGNRIVGVLEKGTQRDRIRSAIEILALAAREEAVLTSSEVADLLNLAPSSLSGKKRFDRKGFTFIKVGKEGRESAWRVIKATLPDVQ